MKGMGDHFGPEGRECGGQETRAQGIGKSLKKERKTRKEITFIPKENGRKPHYLLKWRKLWGAKEEQDRGARELGIELHS